MTLFEANFNTEFPEIQNGQFVVFHAEKTTGIVLNADGSRNLGGETEWLVFDSLEEAENYCQLKMADYPTIEFNIYNSSQKWVKVVS